MMSEMLKRHENEQSIHDIPMFSGKNIDFDEWIVQIEKVSKLMGKPEYVLTLTKSSGTPYQNDLLDSKQYCMEQIKKETARGILLCHSRCTCSHWSIKNII